MKFLRPFIVGIIIIIAVSAAILILRTPNSGDGTVATSTINARQSTSTPKISKTAPAPLSKTVKIGDGLKAQFAFTAYGASRSYDGTFTDITYTLVPNRQAVGVANASAMTGTVIINPASITIDPSVASFLPKELCAVAILNCAANPTITYTLNSLIGQGTQFTADGLLNFHGITKPISFPVTKTVTTDKKTGIETITYSADVRFNTTPFNFTFTNINPEVRLRFSVSVE
jgi:polyisoprenoid-binding protein YceI